MLAAVAY